MSPLVTALIFFGLILVIGLMAKVAIGMWMKRSSVDLSDPSRQAGPIASADADKRPP